MADLANTAHTVRAHVLHFLDNPIESDDSSAWQYFDNGAPLIEHGRMAPYDQGERQAATQPQKKETT